MKCRFLRLNSNKNYFGNVISQKLYDSQHHVPMRPLDSQVRKIKSFWLKAKLQLTKLDPRFYFLACPACSKLCGAAYETEFTCLYCNSDFPSPNPQLRFQADLFDGTGTLTVHVQDKEGQILLHTSAETIINSNKKEDKFDPQLINEQLKELQMLYHVRTSTTDVRGKPTTRYTTIACVPTNNVPSLLPGEECSSSNREKTLSPDTPMLELEEPTFVVHNHVLTDNLDIQEPPLPSKRSSAQVPSPEIQSPKHAKQD